MQADRIEPSDLVQRAARRTALSKIILAVRFEPTDGRERRRDQCMVLRPQPDSRDCRDLPRLPGHGARSKRHWAVALRVPPTAAANMTLVLIISEAPGYFGGLPEISKIAKFQNPVITTGYKRDSHATHELIEGER